MPRVCLVGPPTMRHRGSTFPPLTLTHLATILNRYQPDYPLVVDAIDLQLLFARSSLRMDSENVHDEILRRIRPEQYDLLLFPTMCNNLPLTVSIAEDCKQVNPGILTVIGGVHATLVADRIIERIPAIDVVVRGEGDRTILEIVDALARKDAFHAIPGIVCRHDGNVHTSEDRALLEDLDSLPMPAFDLVGPLDQYQSERAFGDYAAFIDVGRGCPFRCSFCAATLMWKRTVRQKSAGRLVSEMEYLHAKYGIGHFYFNQDEFTANGRAVGDLCDALCRHSRLFDWRVFARLDNLGDELLDRLCEAGCRGVFLGLESGSEDRLKAIRKRVPLHRTLERINDLRSRGIECIVSFILGFPDESAAETNATLSLALELRKRRVQVNMQLLTPHPGTDLWAEHGHQIALFPDLYPHYDNSEFLSPREHVLIAAHPEIFTVFYNFPTVAQPFRRLFNIYYDYRRLLETHAGLLSEIFSRAAFGMVEFHEMWRKQLHRERLIDDRDSVLNTDQLHDCLRRFTEGVTC